MDRGNAVTEQDIAELLRNARMTAGMTQEQAAKATNHCSNTIHHWRASVSRLSALTTAGVSSPLTSSYSCLNPAIFSALRGP